MVPFLVGTESDNLMKAVLQEHVGCFKHMTTENKNRILSYDQILQGNSKISLGNKIYLTESLEHELEGKAIGEIVYLSADKSMGFALCKLDVVTALSGKQKMVISAPTETEKDKPQIIGELAVFKPEWFTGLDDHGIGVELD